MIKVKWEDYDSCPHEREFTNLRQAIELSKHLKDKANITAHIEVDNCVYIGAMGVNMVVDGKLPNGEVYNWYKRRPNPKEQ